MKPSFVGMAVDVLCLLLLALSAFIVIFLSLSVGQAPAEEIEVEPETDIAIDEPSPGVAPVSDASAHYGQLEAELHACRENEGDLTEEISDLVLVVADYQEHQVNFHRFCEIKTPFPGSENARESFLNDTMKHAE